MKKSSLLLSIALALTIGAYANTVRYEFVYDDNDQIVNNAAVHSWSKVPGYFTGTHRHQAWRPRTSNQNIKPCIIKSGGTTAVGM
jgi:hypothetical protein